MTPVLILSFILGYFVVLLFVSWLTGERTDNRTFFLANRSSPWFVVAFGMVGATLSGITFLSIPGVVGDFGEVNHQFSYMQVVFGYLAGYLVIGTVLLPLYYQLNLTSIYSYLDQRFGFFSYKTGSFFFLVSRTIGAAFRLYLVAMVLQSFVFDSWGVPFWITVVITIIFIWIYTFRSGIKTIVYTDTLQTLFMLLAVIFSIVLIGQQLDLGLTDMATRIQESNYSKMFFWDWRNENYFFKQFFSGMFITIVMTGLDQDMMQKNLSCRNLKDAQKNMFWFSVILVVVNFIFLCLGALLYIYADTMQIGLPDKTDNLFPMLALKYFTPVTGAVFIIGLAAAAYSSSDSALTALTTSFCVDFLDFENGKENIRTRYYVHIGFSVLLLIVILVFHTIHDQAIISKLFKVAGYTYGPLLGLYSFGLLTNWKIRDKWTPVLCLLTPVICYFISLYSEQLLFGYEVGFELLIINGLLTFIGLLLISDRLKLSRKFS